MLEPRQFTCKDQNGNDRTYTLSKFDCISGREIVSKYPVSNLPKLGEYQISQEIMLKLMTFVYVDINGNPMPLSNATLITNHVPDWEVLAKIEREMLSYNCSFFQNGKGLTSLAELFQKAAEWTSKISTASLVQLFQQIKQHSTNSEPSTL